MGLQIPMLVVAVVRSAETTWTGWAVLHPVLKVNINSVVEFQKWWVLKKQDFWPKIHILIGNHCILRIRGAAVRQNLGMIFTK